MIPSCSCCDSKNNNYRSDFSLKNSCIVMVATAVAIFAIGAMTIALTTLGYPHTHLAHLIGTSGAHHLLVVGSTALFLSIGTLLFPYYVSDESPSQHVNKSQESMLIYSDESSEKSSQVSDEAEKFKERFIANALERLKRGYSESIKPNLDFDTKKLEEKLPFYKNKSVYKQYNMKSYFSTENYIFSIQGLDHLIFKISRTEPDSLEQVEDYVKLRELGRKLCEDHNLFLLRIPFCEWIKIGDTYVIVEEKIPDLNTDFDFQKEWYSWGWQEKRLREYFEELFMQLLFFDCIRKFLDFKYDNIPLNNEGQVILLDLDDNGAVEGLTEAFSKQTGNGLLHYLLLEYVDEFLEQAEVYLTREEFAEVDLKRQKIKARIKQRVEKYQKHQEFLENHQISNYEPVKFDSKNFESQNPQIDTHSLAQFFIKKMNAHLSEHLILYPPIGRRVTLNLRHILPIFQQSIPFEDGNLNTYSPTEFKNKITEVLDALVEHGAIYKYKFPKEIQTSEGNTKLKYPLLKNTVTLYF